MLVFSFGNSVKAMSHVGATTTEGYDNRIKSFRKRLGMPEDGRQASRAGMRIPNRPKEELAMRSLLSRLNGKLQVRRVCAACVDDVLPTVGADVLFDRRHHGSKKIS